MNEERFRIIQKKISEGRKRGIALKKVLSKLDNIEED